MHDIQLTFINRSNDAKNTPIVIFQKNVAKNADEPAIAWRVIRDCPPGKRETFNFPTALEVGAADRHGAHTVRLPAEHGQLFAMTMTSPGGLLEYVAHGTSASELQVLNCMPIGAIKAHAYRASKLLAVRASHAPQRTAAFAFKPTIWITTAPDIEEGEPIEPEEMAGATEIPLLGIVSADIVMTGDAPGTFRFTLENVEMA